MIRSIEQYLSQLKKELSGCDPATIQDALSDTEEHLRTALSNAVEEANISEPDALSQVIEKYGMPDEIAKAYRENESRIKPALARSDYITEEGKPEREVQRSRLGRFFGIFTDPRAWGAFLYLLFSLATGIIYFTWVVTGISLSAGLMILIIGLPFAALFILSIRGISLLEGLLVEALLGVRMPRRSRFYHKEAGWWLRLKQLITDKHTWLSLIYMILQFPLGIFYFTTIVTLTAVSLFFAAFPVLQLGFNIPFANINSVSYYLTPWMLPVSLIAGVLLATLTMHLVRYLGRWHGAMAKALLVRI